MSTQKKSFVLSAIKEIIFLIIGILIAVSINNWNEARKDKIELRKILIAVSEDLKNDIKEVDEVLGFYNKAEKNFVKILNDSITRKDYEEDPRIAYLILGFPEISFDSRGINLLKEYNTGSQMSNDTLVNEIIDFYTERMLEIEVDDKMRADDFKDNYKHWKKNYHWWANYLYKREMSGFVEYALTDKDYKNRVATVHFLAYLVFLPEIKRFKEEAEIIISKIHENKN